MFNALFLAGVGRGQEKSLSASFIGESSGYADFCAVAARLSLTALVLNPAQAHLWAFAQVLPIA